MNFLYQRTDSRSKNSHEEISFFMRKPIPFEYAGLTLIPFQFVYVSMVLLMLGFIKKSQHFLQAKDFKHIVITHGTDTLIETAKYLGSRSTAEGDGNTSFLLFFVVFFLGGGVEFGMLDSVCFSLSWRNLMV